MEMLRMSGISKSFFGVTVLDNVDFTVNQGEVHALLGENGAGKSTLMNILAGVYTRDSGKVTFEGKAMDHITVQSSEQAGIAFVHQELNLFNDLKVFENIFLRKELLTKAGTLDKKRMIAQTAELFEHLGVNIDPSATVSELETSKKQLLEIAKALHANAKLLILDEPTTALNNKEIEHLFAIVRRLRDEGKSFIFISHKMTEIFSLADQYTVLRNGQMISTGSIANTTPTDVTRMMVGSSYSDSDIYEPRELGDPILELEDYCGQGFENVNLSIRRGEIVGFTGLKGAGVSELMQAIFGVTAATGGSLRVMGRAAEGGIHRAMKNSVAMIAANRKENSILPDFTLLENNYVSEHTLSRRKPLIRRRQEREKFSRLRALLNIRCNGEGDLITSLSGGKQQKVILARWLNTNADVLLMDNSTQGIDVGAKAEIYRLILQLAQQDKTILVNTLEIPELQKVADRCVVFYHGHVQQVLSHAEITEERVMLAATNAINAAEGAVGQ